MVMNQKPTGRATSMPAGLAFGVLVSMAITLFSTALIAWLVSSEHMEEIQIGYGIMVALMASSFAGACSAAGRIKRRRFLICILSGMLYFAVLLSITALFFGGQYEAVAVTGGLVIGGSMLAVLAGRQSNRPRNRKKIRIANR